MIRDIKIIMRLFSAWGLFMEQKVKYYFRLFQTEFQTFMLSVASMRLLQIYLEVNEI